MMNVSEPFIRRPVATSLLSVGILILGAVAYAFLPVAPLPKVDFATISVSAALPGVTRRPLRPRWPPVGTAVLPDRGGERDHLGVFPRRRVRDHPVRPVARH